jgi:hypothetical protein
LAAYGPARSPDREHYRERLPSIHDLPRGHGLETAAGIQQGPHASLDAALAEIENIPGASAGAILAKASLRRRLIPFQWRCGGREALGVIVTPSVARCVARSARNLLQAVEQSGTCLGHAGIGRLAARHHRPAAFFDIRRLLP